LSLRSVSEVEQIRNKEMVRDGIITSNGIGLDCSSKVVGVILNRYILSSLAKILWSFSWRLSQLYLRP
jgi:hypothetical protein